MELLAGCLEIDIRLNVPSAAARKAFIEGRLLPLSGGLEAGFGERLLTEMEESGNKHVNKLATSIHLHYAIASTKK